MKLSELIQQLLDVARELNPGEFDTDILSGEIGNDPDVRIAYQSSYPLAACVANMELVGNDETNQNVLWIAASETVPYDESPYAPRAAWGE